MQKYEVPFCESGSEYYMAGNNYENELSGLTGYLIELNQEFELGVEVESIKITLKDLGDKDETTEVFLVFTMCAKDVDVCFETNCWGYQPAPKEALLIEVGKARADSHFKTKFFEVYLKSAGVPLCNLLEDSADIYFGTYEDMLDLQLCEEARFCILGKNNWDQDFQ